MEIFSKYETRKQKNNGFHIVKQKTIKHKNCKKRKLIFKDFLNILSKGWVV